MKMAEVIALRVQVYIEEMGATGPETLFSRFGAWLTEETSTQALAPGHIDPIELATAMAKLPATQAILRQRPEQVQGWIGSLEGRVENLAFVYARRHSSNDVAPFRTRAMAYSGLIDSLKDALTGEPGKRSKWTLPAAAAPIAAPIG